MTETIAALPASAPPEDSVFDHALIEAAFALAAEHGWYGVSVPGAARRAGLDFPRARARFSGIGAILCRLGSIADQAALEDFAPADTVRESVFDLLMARFDAMVFVRPGLRALLRALPADPFTALLLMDATARSMAWLLAACGVETGGLRGKLRVKGMVAVWLYALRAFVTDESADLATTMAALDRALERAERAAAWLEGAASPVPAPKPFPEDEDGQDEDFAAPA
jgi:AcrR family transcriptional regulator